MDLPLCAAARIPLFADGLRITEPGQDRMLTALAGTGITDLIGRLAKRYGLDPGTGGWRETEEPDGYSGYAARRNAVTERDCAGANPRQGTRNIRDNI